MPKPIYFLVGVEEIAAGAFMRRAGEFPGVLTVEPQLERTRPTPAAPAGNGRAPSGSIEQAVLAILADGPQHLRDITAALGGRPNQTSGALWNLKKKGQVVSVGVGRWQSTGTAPAAPAPASARKGPGGRASQGASRQVMLDALAAAPLRPMDIRTALAAAGVSPKSLSGIVDRGKRDGIIKKNSEGQYELTAKGRKQGADANG